MIRCHTCPAPLSSVDIRSGCRRCAICRSQTPRIYTRSAKVKPETPVHLKGHTALPHKTVPTPLVNGESWWMQVPREQFVAEAMRRFPGSVAQGLLMQHASFDL